MNILFLDLSTKSTGYCIGNDQQQILKYGCITASSTNNLARIRKVQSEIIQLIKDYNIEKIVAEDVHPEEYGYAATSRLLLWLQGAVMLGAHEINKNYTSKSLELMQATEWRKKLGIKTGRGVRRESLKLADVKFIKDKYNIEANDDVCDALCLFTAYFVPDVREEDAGFNWG